MHIFSHIRQTMLIERLIITEVKRGQNGRGVKRRRQGEGGDPEDESGGSVPQTRWVPEGDMTSVGLTSGVKKVRSTTRFALRDLGAAARQPLCAMQKTLRLSRLFEGGQ